MNRTPSLRGDPSSDRVPARVLVTGATGFVGVNLVKGLAQRGYEVLALARREPGEVTRAYLDPVWHRVRFVVGDVTDRDRMIELACGGVTNIVHAAAVTATLDEERAETARVFEVNTGGTLNLLEAARECSAERFVFISSGGLYGPAPPVPALDESTPLRGRNMYAISKRASEDLTLRYGELHGLDVVVGRLGTTYGPMERATGSRSNLSAIQTAIHAFREASSTGLLAVRGAEIFRDFIHIDDAVNALAGLTVSPAIQRQVYNVGSPVAYPLRDALDVLAMVTGATWTEAGEEELEVAVSQTPLQARASMDTKRLEGDLGWRPRFDLAAGTRATYAWTETWDREHPGWDRSRT